MFVMKKESILPRCSLTSAAKAAASKQASNRRGESRRHPKPAAAGEGDRTTRNQTLFMGFNGAADTGPSQYCL
jgi:hypothetical protein